MGISGTPEATGDAQLATRLTTAETDIDAIAPLGVGAWTTYIPTLVQSVAVTKTVTRATYQRVGRLVIVHFNLSVTGAGTAGVALEVGLPVAAAHSNAAVGSFYYFDAGSTIYTGAVVGNTTTTARLYVSGNGNPFGINPAVTAAATDVLIGSVTYEAAT